MPRLTTAGHLPATIPAFRQAYGFDRWQVMFGGVAERRVTRVVQQAGEAQHLIPVIEVRLGESAERLGLGLDQTPEAIGGQVHDAQRVLETVVDGPWVDQ